MKDVTVQIIGEPASVAEFLCEIGKRGIMSFPILPTDQEESLPNCQVTNSNDEPSKEENDAFASVPDPVKEAMDDLPTTQESKSEVAPSEVTPAEKPSVTYAQLQEAMKEYGLRYKQRHPKSDVPSIKDYLLRVCEVVGGAGKGEGSKGIKESLYDTVYRFFLEDSEI